MLLGNVTPCFCPRRDRPRAHCLHADAAAKAAKARAKGDTGHIKRSMLGWPAVLKGGTKHVFSSDIPEGGTWGSPRGKNVTCIPHQNAIMTGILESPSRRSTRRTKQSSVRTRPPWSCSSPLAATAFACTKIAGIGGGGLTVLATGAIGWGSSSCACDASCPTCHAWTDVSPCLFGLPGRGRVKNALPFARIGRFACLKQVPRTDGPPPLTGVRVDGPEPVPKCEPRKRNLPVTAARRTRALPDATGTR